MTFSFLLEDYPIVHRSVVALPPPSGSITTARWQHYHRAVYDGKMYIYKRQDAHLQTARCLFANGKMLI